MPKDYARKTRKKRRRKSKTAPGWMWLTAGLAVGLLLAGLYFLSQHQQHHVKAKQPIKHKTLKTNLPEFDFYTVLQKTKVPVINARPVQPVIKPTDQYMLQVASVKQYTDADRLKAELTLLGFNVFIQKYKAGKITLNRVNIGPYASTQAAKLDQNRLRQNKINSLLLKVK